MAISHFDGVQMAITKANSMEAKMREDLLFFEKNPDLAGLLNAKKICAAQFVYEFSDKKFQSSSDDEILNCGVEKFYIKKIELDSSNKTIRKKGAKRNDDPNASFYINISYTGDSFLFNHQPSTYNIQVPMGNVFEGVLSIPIYVNSMQNDDDKKNEIDSRINNIESHLNWVSSQIDEYNESLPKIILGEIKNRRDANEKFLQTSKSLGIPIETDN